MQVISTMTTNTQIEQPAVNESTVNDFNKTAGLNAQKSPENKLPSKTASEGKEHKDSAPNQKNFAKMLSEQALKKEIQTPDLQSKNILLVKAEKKTVNEAGLFLKNTTPAGKNILASMKKNTAKKALISDKEETGKADAKSGKVHYERTDFIKVDEKDKADEDEVKNESSLIAMAVSIEKKDGKNSVKNTDSVESASAVGAHKKGADKKELEHKAVFTEKQADSSQKSDEENLIKDTSFQMNTIAGPEKAETKNIDSVDGIKFNDQLQNEPIVLVTDRRGQADLAEGKPVEPTTLIRQALKESGNSEIVQRAQFILKDQSSGEIRLTLKPESLGTVRINLTLDDHRVLGRIIVDSPEVKAAFDDNMGDLRERMQRGGFTMGRLDVSVGGQQKEGDGFFQQNTRSDAPFYSERHREGNKAFNQIQDTPRVDNYRSVLVDMKA